VTVPKKHLTIWQPVFLILIIP